MPDIDNTRDTGTVEPIEPTRPGGGHGRDHGGDAGERPIGDIDERSSFDRWAREIGRGLRKPAPHDGLQLVALRHQAIVRRRAGIATAVGVVLVLGVAGALVARRGDGSNPVISPTSVPGTAAATTAAPDPTATTSLGSAPTVTTAAAGSTIAIHDTGRVTPTGPTATAAAGSDDAAIASAALMTAAKLGADWTDDTVPFRQADLQSTVPACASAPKPNASNNGKVVSRSAGDVFQTVEVYADVADVSRAMDWHATEEGRACTLGFIEAATRMVSPGARVTATATSVPATQLHGDRVVSFGVHDDINGSAADSRTFVQTYTQVGRMITISALSPEQPDGKAPIGSIDHTLAEAVFLVTQALTGAAAPATPTTAPAGSGNVPAGTLVFTGTTVDTDAKTVNEGGTSVKTGVTTFSGDLVGPAPFREVANVASFVFTGTIKGIGTGTLAFDDPNRGTDEQGRFTSNGPIHDGTGDFAGYTGKIYFVGTTGSGAFATYRVELTKPTS